MFKKSRKGALEGIILAAAAGIVLLMVGLAFLRNLDIVSDVWLCRLTVTIRSVKIPVLNTNMISTPLFCPTKMIEIKDDGIYIGKSKDVDFNRNDNRDEKEDKIKKYIARRMYDCWSQFLEGTSNPWSVWRGGGPYCMICSDINFDKEFSEKISRINDFGEFLNTEKPSGVSKQTFAEYFGGEIEACEEWTDEGVCIKKSDNIYIDTSQQLYLIYQLRDPGAEAAEEYLRGYRSGCVAGVHPGDIRFIMPIINGRNPGTGCAIGGASVPITLVGDQIWELAANIILIPAEMVKEDICDRME